MAKQTIKDKVIAAAEVLKACTDHNALRVWAISNGMDNRSAFPKFKDALLEIGVNYEIIRSGKQTEKLEDLLSKVSHEITLFTDAKASNDRFGICDADGIPVWYGKFFESDSDYNGEQSSGELAAACKAVWLASKIKDAVQADAVKLILMVDAQWLTYQDHSGQKGYKLSQMARKYGIVLDVQWIPGKENPADEYTVCSGYMKWSDNNLADLAVKIESND